MEYYFSLTRMAIIKETTTVDNSMEKLRASYVAGEDVKCYRHSGKQFGITLKT